MRTRVVTVSHATGAGGESAGRGVADRLGFRYIDEEIITLAAEKEGVDPALVADAERRKGLLARIMDNIAEGAVVDAGGGGGVLVPEAFAVARREDLRTLIVEAIRATAELGDVVIVAHAASIPLAGRDDVLRVLITASVETRMKRLAKGGQGAVGDAAKFVKQSDVARADYFQRFYRIERELPTHYDLVVNTDALKLDEAADIIVAAARRRA